MMKTIAVFMLALTGIVAPAVAQQEPPTGPGRQNRPMRPGLAPAEVADMLDAFALMQAEKQLGLRDAQFGDFVTRLKQLQQTRRRNRQGRQQILRELNRLTAPQRGEGDDTQVKDRLKALREHDERAAAELRRAYDSLDEVLDARQQARFRLFEEHLERRKLELLMRARAGAATRPGPQPNR
jgi:DNA repair ATPase RecN